MDSEVIDPLLGLFNQRIAVDLPGEFLSLAAHLLQGLINWHGTNRHGRVAQDPLTRLVDVLAGGQVHDRIGSPARGPGHLFDLFIDRGRHCGVADVGVDLHQEIPPNDHRLGLGVVDIGRNDRPSACHLVAHMLWRDALADGDELHLRGDLATSRVVHLGDAAARSSPQGLSW